jgi:PAS domain S-box-containing protein
MTYAVQKAAWPLLSPFAWFLFCAAVFISSWFEGLWSGIGATLLSAVLICWSFLAPEGSFPIAATKYVVSIATFVSVGLVFSAFHERARREHRACALLLADTARTNERLRQVINDRKIFAALIENCSDFIGIADANGKPEYLNPAGRRMVGLPPDYPVENTQILEYYPPDQRPFASDVILKSMIEEGHWHGETHFRHWRTQEPIPVHDTHFMIRESESGQLLGMGTITRDISDIKRAWSVAAMNEARFHALVSASAQIVWTTDAGGRVVEDSPSWRAFTGLIYEQLKGFGWLDAFHPEDRERSLALWTHAVTAKSPVINECRIRHVTGEWRWFSVRAVPLLRPDGSVKEWVGMNTDISDRKQAEAEQRFLSQVSSALASTIDYEATLETLALLVVGELADCCIINLVEDAGQLRRLRVIHRDSAKARVAHDLQQTQLDARRPHLASTVLETREPLLMNEVTDEYLASVAQTDEQARALRELAPQSLMAVPLTAHGRLLGALLFIRMSTRTPYRRRDLRLAQDLGARAALAVHNARLYSTARHATRARDEVLGIVAHDLRNPLNSILIQTQVLQRGRRGGDRRSPEGPERIRKAAMRMNHLIQDLLDVSKIESAELSIDRGRLPVRELMLDAMEGQKFLLSSAGLEFMLDAAEDLPVISADRNRLLQVLENLVGNSVKFTAASGRITLGAKPKDGEVLFWVQDTGSGIAPENLPHLFDRFWQARKGAQRESGLGLSIARGIVEAHGGRIWVESALGKGTTVYFTIPCATPIGEERVGDTSERSNS